MWSLAKINKITSGSATSHVVISYPEALFEIVVAPQILDRTRINLKINEPLDADTMIEVLVEYGFEHVHGDESDTSFD